jgi:hypothetical protein
VIPEMRLSVPRDSLVQIPAKAGGFRAKRADKPPNLMKIIDECSEYRNDVQEFILS